MSAIKLRTYGGIIPRTAPKLLPDVSAQVAENCHMRRGRLEPFKAASRNVLESGSYAEIANTTQSFYLWRHGTTWEWLSWDFDTDVVQCPIADDQYSRLYWVSKNVDTRLQVQYWLAGFGYNRDVYIKKPTNAPGATCTTPADPTHDAYYVLTYVDDLGQEGPPSDKSVMVSFIAGTTTVTITWDKTDATPTIDHVRIYRSAAGTSKDAFYFLAEVDVGTETYADTKTDADLAEEITLLENPPELLEGLILHPNGFLVAFKGKDLYFSEPYLPYSWPTEYRLTMEYDIVGLGVSCGNILVLTKGIPYSVAGSHPEWMTVQQLPTGLACVSKTSIAQLGQMVCYASADGLVIAHCGGTFAMATDRYFTRAQWQAWGPHSMKAAVQDGKYFAFSRLTQPTDAPTVNYTPPATPTTTARYVVTYVDAYGGENAASPASAAVSIIPGTTTVAVSWAQPPGPGVTEVAGVSKVRVYRSKGAGFQLLDGSYVYRYYLVGEADNAVPVYTLNDTLTDAALGAELDPWLGNLVFDIGSEEKALTTTDQVTSAIFSDLVNDTLYLSQSDAEAASGYNRIWEWEGGSTYLTLRWRTKEITSVFETFWSSGKVIADVYPVKLRFRVGNVLMFERSVPDATAFRLKSLAAERQWSVEALVAGPIDEIRLASSMEGLR